MLKRLIRSEEEVGITAYIGTHEKFEGIVKSRYSDFHVHEVDPNGQIVRLTSFDLPTIPEETVSPHDPVLTKWITDEFRDGVKALQDDGGKSQSQHWALRKVPSVTLNVTDMTKEERTKAHVWLRTFDKVVAETVRKFDQLFLVVSAKPKQNTRARRPASQKKFTHCILYKEGIESSEAISFLANKLRLKPNLITHAGTKDKRAKTTQRICISNIEASRLLRVNEGSCQTKLGNFEYHDKKIFLGDLNGNHFTILLRDVRCSSPDLKATVTTAVDSLRENGFINYYGLQRFGSYDIPNHVIGRAIMERNWVEAFDMILSLKANDKPEIIKAKEAWLNRRDPVSAAKLIPSWHRSIESHLLYGLSKFYEENNFVAAFCRIPRNSRLLYVHSLQSYIWNQAASFRVSRHGLKPVVGDLVYVNPSSSTSTDPAPCQGDDDSTSTVSPADQGSGVKVKPQVKVLTENDLEAYRITDVLLPLEGTDIKYPENDVKQFYQTSGFASHLKGDNNAICYKFGCEQLPGAYRKLIVIPERVSCQIIPYSVSDDLDSFIPSDLDKLTTSQSQPVSSNSKSDQVSSTKESIEGEDENAEITTDTAPNPTKTSKCKTCVILDCTLPTSAYATMALREILIGSQLDSEEPELPDNELDLIDNSLSNKRKADEQTVSGIESPHKTSKKQALD